MIQCVVIYTHMYDWTKKMYGKRNTINRIYTYEKHKYPIEKIGQII